MPYYVGLRDSTTDWASLAKTGGEVFVTRYSTQTITIEPAGALGITLTITIPVALFDRVAALREASTAKTAHGVQINLTWQAHGAVPDDVTVFVHVLGANGQLLAQADGDPLAGTYPFAQWPQGLVVDDIRQVDVSNAAAVRVGLYSRSSGERLSATASDGTPLADNAVTIDIH